MTTLFIAGRGVIKSQILETKYIAEGRDMASCKDTTELWFPPKKTPSIGISITSSAWYEHLRPGMNIIGLVWITPYYSHGIDSTFC